MGVIEVVCGRDACFLKLEEIDLLSLERYELVLFRRAVIASRDWHILLGWKFKSFLTES